MAGAGFPVPETLAIVGGTARPSFSLHLASEQEIAGFLGGWSEWPLFAKPIDGVFSVGTLQISGRDGAYLAVDGHGMVPVAELASYMSAMSTEGYLLQRCLTPIAGSPFDHTPAVATVRLLILLGAGGPTLESAVVKLPAAGATADNYWRPGNMLGAVDDDTGAITRVVSGVGADMQVHDRHPTSGAPFGGVTVPGWDALRRCAIDAATAFPALRTQSWDVALTDRGPVPLEVNFGGDFNLHQFAHRRGILSERYIEHLGRCGCKVTLS